MSLRIGRTLPPAAAPLNCRDVISGLVGHFRQCSTLDRLRGELREHFGTGYCFGLSSGKAALVLILEALHELRPERTEVIIPAYTCYSVPSAIVRAGLTVRLCDLAPDSLDYNFDRLAPELDNPRLLCVISTHLFGVPANVGRVRKLVGGREIFLVEDAAQAMGGEWQGRKLGTLGDVGMFSLGRGKALSTVEGGIVLTDNERIGKAISKRLEDVPKYSAVECLKLVLNATALWLLIDPRIYWLPKALPFLKLGETLLQIDFPIRRLSGFQAGLAKRWQPKLAAMKKARAENAARILKHGIAPFGIANGGITEVIRLPFLVKSRKLRTALLKASDDLGLGIAPGYPDAIDGIAELGYRNYGPGFPVAKALAENLISLPVHPLVNKGDIDRIARFMKTQTSGGEET